MSNKEIFELSEKVEKELTEFDERLKKVEYAINALLALIEDAEIKKRVGENTIWKQV